MSDEQMQSVCPWAAQCETEASRIASLDADLTQAVQMYTDAAGERDKALVDLAAAQSYATTLAVSMHKQHYAEAAPNWKPLPDLVGLLTQIDNMYAGLRTDLEALEVENKRLVGANLATLREDLAAAQAVLPCGHHHSLMLESAETGEPLYCELCDCISRRNDAETMEAEARAEAAALLALLIRYRNEVPLGHQPHMIAHLVDAAIDAAKESGNG